MITDQTLLEYSQDLLNESESKQIETALRDSEDLRQRLHKLLNQALSGEHTIGQIWRSQHLSCPSRSTWGRYILQLVSAGELNYFQFHLNVVGCEVCLSNLTDLQDQYRQEQETELDNLSAVNEREARRNKFFQSSRGFIAGH